AAEPSGRTRPAALITTERSTCAFDRPGACIEAVERTGTDHDPGRSGSNRLTIPSSGALYRTWRSNSRVVSRSDDRLWRHSFESASKDPRASLAACARLRNQ